MVSRGTIGSFSIASLSAFSMGETEGGFGL